jgi:hypothetical protein
MDNQCEIKAYCLGEIPGKVTDAAACNRNISLGYCKKIKVPAGRSSVCYFCSQTIPLALPKLTPALSAIQLHSPLFV